MNELLLWAIRRVRAQTLGLATDIPAERSCLQSQPGEHHPTWVLGHLVLGDTYLLSLLGAEDLPADFPALLARYGPQAPPLPTAGAYDPYSVLVERLRVADARRLEAIDRLTPDALSRATPDPVLAQAQPTIAHHLQALVCHEGYHAGQLAAWRRAHGLAPTPWAFAPKA